MYFMIVRLLTEHHFEFLSLKGGYTCQNATLLDISCTGSFIFSICRYTMVQMTRVLLLVIIVVLILYLSWHHNLDKCLCATTHKELQKATGFLPRFTHQRKVFVPAPKHIHCSKYLTEHPMIFRM